MPKVKGMQMKNLLMPLDDLRTQQHKSTTVVCLALSLCLCSLMVCPVAAQDEQAPETITSEPMNENSGAPGMTEGPADANSKQVPAPRARGFGQFQILLIIVMIVFVFMMFRGPRKKQAEHRKMVQSLKKNDRVRTIGGIYGTVVDVREDEIVLKIDESSNTKIKVTPSAIGTRLSDEKS